MEKYKMTAYEYALSLVNGKEFNELEELKAVVDDICSNHDVECKLCYAGSYDSCGYDCTYYALVILENGSIMSIDVQVETY